MAKPLGPKKKIRSSRSLIHARRQMLEEINERCVDVANRRGVNLFEMLLEYALGNEKALGYEGTRTRVLKDGGVIQENWITPEMRFMATKEALKYVAPQLSAIALTDLAKPSDDEENETRPATRQEIIDAIKRDPFFQVKPNEVIDVTPEIEPDSDPEKSHNDPFKG